MCMWLVGSVGLVYWECSETIVWLFGSYFITKFKETWVVRRVCGTATVVWMSRCFSPLTLCRTEVWCCAPWELSFSKSRPEEHLPSTHHVQSGLLCITLLIMRCCSVTHEKSWEIKQAYLKEEQWNYKKHWASTEAGWKSEEQSLTAQ